METRADKTGSVGGGDGESMSRRSSSSTKISTGASSMQNLPDRSINPAEISEFEPAFPTTNKSVGKHIGEDVRMEDAEPEIKGPQPKKKKGMASVIKPKKNSKAGTSSKPTKKKRGNTHQVEKSQTTGEAEEDGGDEAADDDEESDHGPYCICRGPDDHRWMISCDNCEDWFHGECVNIDKATGETLIQRYICPNCTDGKHYVTRYKKMCALDGCANPARIYDAAKPSIFCCQDHCNKWWEQLIASLPKGEAAHSGAGEAALDGLNQAEFMGLLASTSRLSLDGTVDKPWKLGDVPFGVPPDFWEHVDPAAVLTREERTFLESSVADRYNLAEEIVLCKKMLQLLDMAAEQRRVSIAAKRIESDGCGYDARLDSVGAQHAFAAFIKSPTAEAIFAAGKLGDPYPTTRPAEDGTTTPATDPDALDPPHLYAGMPDPLGGGMCERRRCKPHAGWYNTHARGVRYQIKELAAQAKEKLDAETRVRNGAAVRYRRKMHEKNWVVPLDSSSSASGGSSVGDDEDEEAMEVDENRTDTD